MNDIVAVDPVVEEYRRDGFMIFRGLIDPELIAEAREHVEWIQRRHPHLRPEHFHHPLMRDDAFWVRMVTDERLVDLAQRFLGPDLACFTAHYICKPPQDGQAVLWHQDGAYWNLQPMEALTVWVAIDDSQPDNGCLRMLPGTHRLELAPIVLRDDVPNMLCSSVPAEMVDEDAAVDVVLRAGDVSIHHPNIIHGSEENRSPSRRCGLDIGYIRTSTRIGTTGLYLNPLLVRGRAIEGINRYRRWPEYEPEHTIPFRGCERWNERVHELNRRPGVVESEAREADVVELTAHMMRRLQAGTTKQVQGSS
ncbi:MAG: phytanoyl-CoA dioxygenase family protein [Myxococcales bacterium]|nr:phytanoyl-CoA dioxygenase family protein [Myxococcales bacterium]